MTTSQKLTYVNLLYTKVAECYSPNGTVLHKYSPAAFTELGNVIGKQLNLDHSGVSLATFQRYLTSVRDTGRQFPSESVLNTLASYVYGYNELDRNAWRTFINDLKNQPTKEVEERREEEKIDEPIIIQDMYDQKALMDLVVKGELEEVLNFLLQKPSSPKQQIEIAELASQLKELKRDMRVNIITREENSRRMSRIRMSTLEFIQELAT